MGAGQVDLMLPSELLHSSGLLLTAQREPVEPAGEPSVGLDQLRGDDRVGARLFRQQLNDKVQ